MFIVKNGGRGARPGMDVNDGSVFFIVNCHCLLNIATIVVWADDVKNLDWPQRQNGFSINHMHLKESLPAK